MNIVITGASGGIGAALAKVRGARGDAVVLAARREPELRAAAAACGPRATAVVADVARDAGHLVNVSSFLGRIPLVSIRSMYSAAKAALISLTASLRLELAERAPGVHVSVVMPGIVRTEFARNALNAPPAAGGWSGPPGSGAPVASQTAGEVAAAISGLIDQPAPAPELYTQPGQPGMALEYVRDPAGFEQQLRRR